MRAPDHGAPVHAAGPTLPGSGAFAALSALLPMALHLLWQVATLSPQDGHNTLARFRSNRDAGLLMFLACLVVGTAA